MGLLVSILLLLVFALDLALGIPFRKASVAMDIGVIVAAGFLGYLSWATYREQAR
jgi:hypothetical protein